MGWLWGFGVIAPRVIFCDYQGPGGVTMFKIDDRQIQELEKDLKAFAGRALPFATRKTLNDAAFATQKIARADVDRDFVLRNRFTVQSIRVEQTRTLSMRRQAAIVGSTADYMADQEFGATETARGSEGVPIPTSYAAGLSENAQPRTRLPRKPNKIQNIKLRNRGNGSMTRKQRNLVSIQSAAEGKGSKFVFLDFGRKRGIFRVIGGKRKPKIKMIYDLSERSVRIPATPWLRPSYNEAARMIPAFYADALRFQLKRRGLFKP